MSAVYFAKVGRYVKIGFSSNPQRRMKQLLNSSILIYPDDFDHAAPLEVVLVIPFCRRRDERNMQLLFAHHWEAGEWFHWTPAFRYQMQTMQFVTHDARLRILRAARKELGIVGEGESVKEVRWGKQPAEILAEAKARRLNDLHPQERAA